MKLAENFRFERHKERNYKWFVGKICLECVCKKYDEVRGILL